MRITILAAVAIAGLAAGDAAMIERGHVSLQQLAASGKPELSTNVRGTQVAGGWYPGATQQQSAANGLPQARTQLAGGWHPQSDTSRDSRQYAASGLPQADTSRPSQV